MPSAGRPPLRSAQAASRDRTASAAAGTGSRLRPRSSTVRMLREILRTPSPPLSTKEGAMVVPIRELMAGATLPSAILAERSEDHVVPLDTQEPRELRAAAQLRRANFTLPRRGTTRTQPPMTASVHSQRPPNPGDFRAGTPTALRYRAVPRHLRSSRRRVLGRFPGSQSTPSRSGYRLVGANAQTLTWHARAWTVCRIVRLSGCATANQKRSRGGSKRSASASDTYGRRTTGETVPKATRPICNGRSSGGRGSVNGYVDRG